MLSLNETWAQAAIEIILSRIRDYGDFQNGNVGVPRKRIVYFGTDCKFSVVMCSSLNKIGLPRDSHMQQPHGCPVIPHTISIIYALPIIHSLSLLYALSILNILLLKIIY